MITEKELLGLASITKDIGEPKERIKQGFYDKQIQDFIKLKAGEFILVDSYCYQSFRTTLSSHLSRKCLLREGQGMHSLRVSEDKIMFIKSDINVKLGKNELLKGVLHNRRNIQD